VRLQFGNPIRIRLKVIQQADAFQSKRSCEFNLINNPGKIRQLSSSMADWTSDAKAGVIDFEVMLGEEFSNDVFKAGVFAASERLAWAGGELPIRDFENGEVHFCPPDVACENHTANVAMALLLDKPHLPCRGIQSAGR
jgi:hypothetical protein